MAPAARISQIMGGLLVAMTLASGEAGAAADGRLATALGIQAPKEAVQAPNILGADPEGRPIRLADFRGEVVFLNFWATWCTPCRLEMPAMEHLYREFQGRGFVVVAVNLREGAQAVRAFVRELHLTFPVVLDPKGAAAMMFLVHGLPTSYLIDRDRIVVGRAMGAREWDSQDGRGYIRALLERRR